MRRRPAHAGLRRQPDGGACDHRGLEDPSQGGCVVGGRGGAGQEHPRQRARHTVHARAGLRIPVVGIAKGPERKRNDFIGLVPRGIDKATLVRVRDEAHRFAISYHKALRRARSMN